MEDKAQDEARLKDLRSRGYLKKSQYDDAGNVESPFDLPESSSSSSSANPTPGDPATPKRRRGEIEVEAKMNKDRRAGKEGDEQQEQQRPHERAKRSRGLQGGRAGGRRQSGQKELLLWNGEFWKVEYKAEVAAGSKYAFEDGTVTVIEANELSARIQPCRKAAIEGMGQ